MTSAVVEAVTELSRATERLVESVRLLDDQDLRAPSAQPGWTRGHVVAHLARNADGLCNLLEWARTGVPRAMYASRHARDTAIEQGSTASAPLMFRDLVRSAHRLGDAIDTLPPDGWDREVALAGGRRVRAADLPSHRLREVRIHHVDLVLDFTTRDWPQEFVATTMEVVVADFAARDDVPAVVLRATDTRREHRVGIGEPLVVEGEEAVLLAWLIGRPAHDVPHARGGVLPSVPAWL